MTYKELVERLCAMKKSKRGVSSIDRFLRCLRRLGDPHLCCPMIHVAGTNGKGSVCGKVATALSRSGHKTGVYTSPHISCYRERIVIDNEKIEEKQVVQLWKQVASLTDEMPSLHFFEITTLLAFLHFQREAVDIAVIEAGIGGRWDTTNVLCPILAIITSIGYDHMDILGATLEEIAWQKAGIIKAEVPLVLGASATFPVMLREAEGQHAPVFVAKGGKTYDEENRHTAAMACEILREQGWVHGPVVENALEYLPSCRLQQSGNTVFDVAHNREGFLRLLDTLDVLYPGKPVSVMLSLGRDKDHTTILRILADRNIPTFLVQPQNRRTIECEVLERVCQEVHHCTYTAVSSVALGWAQVHKSAESLDGLVLVTGSFYLMDEALALAHIPSSYPNALSPFTTSVASVNKIVRSSRVK